MKKANVVDFKTPGRLQDLLPPTTVDTANGSMLLDKYVNSYCPGLNKTLEVVVADSTPDILSIGLLCRAMGFSCK